MTKQKQNFNTFPKKNYLIGCLIVIFILLLGLYFFKWGQVKEDAKYLKSYLVDTRTINLEMNDLEEIEDVLLESPNSYFIYISYTKNEKIYNFEKELKPLIDDYNLADNFYFINVTDIKDKNKNYKEDIENKLKIPNGTIKEVPAILYFTDGKLETKEAIYTINDFKAFLDSKPN